MPNLLIVDDEKSYLRVLKVIFEEEGYSVETKSNGFEALEYLKNTPCDLIISDVRMPDMDGIELLDATRKIAPDIGVVLMTAFGTIDRAREAFKLGADDFIQKPFNNEELKLIVERTLEKQKLINQNRAFQKTQKKNGSIDKIIGQSEPMKKIFEMIEKISAESSTVLINGESGTGKELFARVIHDRSDRSEKPFIPINCGAMPEHLLEAELFGFLKGTFTGAESNRTGLFQASDGGTIFLDEIGDMPQPMQVKMLRVLQDQMIRPVGSAKEVPVDVRVIAATNRNIKEMVDEGNFRRDLFYRLSVIPINIPALRERREDIPELVRHFIEKFTRHSGKRITISGPALEILQNRHWEGNVRELEHIIERAVALLIDGGEIQPEHCTDDFSDNADINKPSTDLPAEGLNFTEYMQALEKDLIIKALQRTRGNQTKAAALLQMPVHACRHLIHKHNLQNKNIDH